jgi:hypothetical protein
MCIRSREPDMSRYLTSARLKEAARGVRAFFVWWHQELEETLIDLSDRLGLQWGRAVHLRPSGNSIEVTYLRHAQIERKESLSLSGTGDAGAQECAVLSGPVTLLIPRSWTLSVHLEFPAAVKNHLRSAIALKLPQSSPLPIGEIYWTFESLAESATAMTVAVIIVRRTAVDEILTRLADRGVRVRADVYPADSSGPSFDMPARAVASPVLWRRLNRGLLVLATFALFGVAWGWHYRLTRQDLALEQAYADAKTAAATDLDRRRQIEHDQSVLRQLSTLEAPSPSSLFLSVLEDSLPAPIWLQSLDAVGREARITLYVPPRAEVAKLLLESPSIRSVTENSRISLGVGITEERVELFVVLTDPPQT